jgi:predicted dehydrogenase
MAAAPPVRFAVVGLGAFGETYLSCLEGLRQVTPIEAIAVCSSSADRAKAIARRYEVPRWYTEVTELVRDPDVDVVCVVTAEQHHKYPTVTALGAGKHVIVEKPLATSVADADEMIAAAQRSSGNLYVGQMLRFEAAYQALSSQIHSGRLGEILSIQSRRNRPAQAVRRYRRTHPIFETGILDIDVMLWLTGARVRTVRSFARTVHPGPTPDLVWAFLEFESGAIGVLETSWLAADRGGLFTDDALNVIGAKGTARIDLSRTPLSIWSESGFQNPDVHYEPRLGAGVGGAFREQLMHFIGCIRANEPDAMVPIADVRHGICVADGIVRSAAQRVDQVISGPG